MGSSNQFFTDAELSCQCGCGAQCTTPELLEALTAIRTVVGPLQVTSGTRCPTHNERVGGAPGSDHLDGNGADVRCLNTQHASAIVRAAIAAGVPRIGLSCRSGGHGFVHIGVLGASDKPVAMWSY